MQRWNGYAWKPPEYAAGLAEAQRVLRSRAEARRCPSLSRSGPGEDGSANPALVKEPLSRSARVRRHDGVLVRGRPTRPAGELTAGRRNSPALPGVRRRAGQGWLGWRR
ncbi:hypothetical protein ACFVJ4_37490 [Streptomyces sp. NPDC127178]|uniref:hypothetical protein n=1 Tax=unclassified Streptomyces TaxID=2593676 RepID=UPI00363AB76B